VSAAGHRERVDENLEVVARLGANACRLSLDWPRLEPQPDRWDEEGWRRAASEDRHRALQSP